MSKSKKHDGHTEGKPADSKAALTVGDFVMFRPESGLTRDTYGTNVGLLCSLFLGPDVDDVSPERRGEVLFAGQLIALNLNLVQLRNY